MGRAKTDEMNGEDPSVKGFVKYLLSGKKLASERKAEKEKEKPSAVKEYGSGGFQRINKAIEEQTK